MDGERPGRRRLRESMASIGAARTKISRKEGRMTTRSLLPAWVRWAGLFAAIRLLAYVVVAVLAGLLSCATVE